MEHEGSGEEEHNDILSTDQSSVSLVVSVSILIHLIDMIKILLLHIPLLCNISIKEYLTKSTYGNIYVLL